MVSELIKESLKLSAGGIILVFLENGFRFEGKILDCDDSFLKILDNRSGKIRFIRLLEIVEAELK